MRSIFEFDDYKTWMKAKIHLKPQHGRGEISRIAECLNVHVTLVSQILRNDKDFTIEQAHTIAEYFGINDLETDYFMNLVQMNRAGTASLKEFFKRQQAELKAKSLHLKNRLNVDRNLTTEESARFYSSWLYSAIRVYCSIGEGKTKEEIAIQFQLKNKELNDAIDFLISTGLLKLKDQGYVVGPQRTHAAFGTPFLKSHLSNWRTKTLESIHSLTPEELMYSSCLSISKKDFAILRERFAEAVKAVNETVQSTEPEEMVVFNLDWTLLKP